MAAAVEGGVSAAGSAGAGEASDGWVAGAELLGVAGVGDCWAKTARVSASVAASAAMKRRFWAEGLASSDEWNMAHL